MHPLSDTADSPQRLRVEAEFSCTEEQLNYRRDALERLCEENKECVQNIEACKRSLSERYVGRWECFSPSIPTHHCGFAFSGNAVKQMQGEQRQMLQKITDNDAQWEKAEEEVTQVVAQHGAIRARLAVRRRLTFMEDEKARVSDNTRDAQQENREKILLAVGFFITSQKETDEMKETLSSQRSVVDLLKVNYDASSCFNRRLEYVDKITINM